MFAAYKQPHPLENYIFIRIRTKSAEYKPMDAMRDCLIACSSEISEVQMAFHDALRKVHDPETRI